MTESPFPLAHACPGCGGVAVAPVVNCGRVPVFCNLLLDSPAAAQAIDRGELRLVGCPRCALIYNAAFEPRLMEYSSAYENSQRHSPRFVEFAEQLAQRLVDRYGLHNRRIVEIGCGDGFFLRHLCRRGGNQGLGFDPALDEPVRGTDGVQLEPGMFQPQQPDTLADLICSRHVLEHLSQPGPLLASVRQSLRGTDSIAYFEMPDAWLTFNGAGIWDMLYEHCLYLTEPSLANLFQANGFVVRDIRTAFDGQFLSIEAGSGDALASPWSGELDAERVLRTCAGFQSQFDRLVQQWDERLAAWTATGRRFVVWGAGAKGIMFLNLVPAAREALGIVDLNPRKQGCYACGTGQAILAPDALRQLSPEVVIAVNPIYRDEIQRTLIELDVPAELVVLTGC